MQANLVAINNTAREIAAGMAYLHNMDILHGDLTVCQSCLEGCCSSGNFLDMLRCSC